LYSLATIADQLAARGGHEKLAELAMMLISTANAELEALNTRSYDGALSRCRVVLAALFGEPEGRWFDVKFWDGSIDRGNNPRPPFTLVLNRPAALRRMLLPPNEMSIVESYISGDVEIEGSMEAASKIAEMIGDRLRSPVAIARLVGLVLRLPGTADDDLANARFPERAKKLGLDVGIDSSRGDWAAQVEAAIGAERVDALLDLVGGGYLEGNLRVLTLRGRMVVVGLTGGASAPFNMSVLLRKRLTIVGTMLRSRPLEEKIALARDFSEKGVPLFESGRLKPVIDRVFGFDEIGAAHQLMESNDTFGKIVLAWK